MIYTIQHTYCLLLTYCKFHCINPLDVHKRMIYKKKRLAITEDNCYGNCKRNLDLVNLSLKRKLFTNVRNFCSLFQGILKVTKSRFSHLFRGPPKLPSLQIQAFYSRTMLWSTVEKITFITKSSFFETFDDLMCTIMSIFSS